MKSTLSTALIAIAGIAFSGQAQALPGGEARLAKMLEGRVAEAPVSCIRNLPTSNMTVIDGTALVFGRGNVIYVNRTADPHAIDDNQVLVYRAGGGASQLRDVDTFTMQDRSTGMFSGNVFLEEFVPYRRVK